MTPQQADKIIAEFMGWWLWVPINYSWGSLWVHKSRVAKSDDTGLNSLVINEYKQNRHKMLTEGEFAGRYSESLDALVEVWEKLKIWSISGNPYCNNPKGKRFSVWDGSDDTNITDNTTYSDTIYLAAATATAKAIQELKT